MTWAIALGLAIQSVALMILFKRLGRRVLTHAGAMFIVLATVYHGLNEVLLWIVPGQDFYRFLVLQRDVDSFVLWVSVAILLLTTDCIIAEKPQEKGAGGGDDHHHGGGMGGMGGMDF